MRESITGFIFCAVAPCCALLRLWRTGQFGQPPARPFNRQLERPSDYSYYTEHTPNSKVKNEIFRRVYCRGGTRMKKESPWQHKMSCNKALLWQSIHLSLRDFFVLLRAFVSIARN